MQDTFSDLTLTTFSLLKNAVTKLGVKAAKKFTFSLNLPTKSTLHSNTMDIRIEARAPVTKQLG